MPVEPKVVIENRVLAGLEDARSLQTIATVYAGLEEYRVYAPARATGNALEWLDSSRVHTPTDRGDNFVEGSERTTIIGWVREKLEASSRTSPIASDPKAENNLYYHVRFHLQDSSSVEVKFDLSRSVLEKRVLEPYRELRSIVISGRTILTQDLKRIEVYESSKPSSEFGPFITELATHSRADWFVGEPGINDVTNELIQTPNIDA